MKLCVFDTISNEFIYGEDKKYGAGKPKNIYLLQNFFRLIDGNYIIPLDGIHQDIGITDINGKPIYADCSIVDLLFNCRFPSFGLIHLLGYLQYNSDELRYEFIVLKNKSNNKIYDVLSFNAETMKKLKIIDTIQENKLGLIKE